MKQALNRNPGLFLVTQALQLLGLASITDSKHRSTWQEGDLPVRIVNSILL